MRRLKTYLPGNAHRLRYPAFTAAQLPIRSGAIKAGVRIVNNERRKNCCVHWSVAGARAVLTLRALRRPILGHPPPTHPSPRPQTRLPSAQSRMTATFAGCTQRHDAF